MDHKELNAVVAQTHTLPILPAIQQRLATVLRDPYCSFKDVGTLLSLDPVLVARVLQIANSTRHALPEKVTTVSKALRIVGFEALRDLVQEAAIPADFTAQPHSGRPFALNDLWLHSLGVAIAGRAIAVRVGYAEPEECYVAGLLHDIGKVVMQQHFPDKFYGTILEAEQMHSTFYHCEVESGEASHAMAGRLLAKQWALPPKLVDSIGWHHTPQLATASPHIIAATHVADILARALGLGSGGDPYVPPVKPGAVRVLGFAHEQVQGVMQELERQFAKTSDMLAA